MKKFLKTPEEVISVLKSGKTVYSDCGEYRMIDGLVVYEESNLCLVNANLPLNEKPFLKESEPFKIEVGKFYKRRDGKKARCFCIEAHVAYFVVDGESSAFSTYMTGNVFNSKEPCEYDIIGPWEE